jgi:PHD/YefM family antitoxin component YafN of YafNO toxin-antitoxin module
MVLLYLFNKIINITNRKSIIIIGDNMVTTLDRIIEKPEFYFLNVLKNNEELIVDSKLGNFVVVPENDWNQMNETINLVNDKISLKSLIEGKLLRNSGETPKHYTIEEIFNDL